MTVKLIGAKRSYIGESLDAKPVTIVGDTVPAGSTFEEMDTGKTFKWNGYDWSLETETQSPLLLAEILNELRGIKAINQELRELHLAVAESM